MTPVEHPSVAGLHTQRVGRQLVAQRAEAGGGAGRPVHGVQPRTQLEDVDLPLVWRPDTGEPEGPHPIGGGRLVAGQVGGVRPRSVEGTPQPLECELEPSVLARAAVDGQEDEVGRLDGVGQCQRVAHSEGLVDGGVAHGELGADRRAHRFDGGSADRVGGERLDLLDVVVQHVEEPDLGVPALDVHQEEADVVARGQQGQSDEAATLPTDLALTGRPAEHHVDTSGARRIAVPRTPGHVLGTERSTE